MSKYYGDFSTGKTVVMPFNTFTAEGASATVTNLAASDVEIHKDGGATQRSSDAGVSVSIDFDGVTGNHLVTIDTSDDTDSGFYASGSDYQVRVEGITVDGQTINAFLGSFSIQNRYMVGTNSAALASVCTETRLAELDAANLPTDVDGIKDKTDGLNFTGTDVKATLDGEEVTTDSTSREASKADVSGLASTGDQMTLENGAITASKFDSWTAFPLTEVDFGSSKIARIGADGDTLETLSDQLDSIGDGVTRIESYVDDEVAEIVENTENIQSDIDDIDGCKSKSLFGA